MVQVYKRKQAEQSQKPTFALAYPLWASIRAIETGSKYHMRKLVTYWTIFSFVSLFEIFFARFLECILIRVPFWPYIKLVIICRLVLPRFDGACYVYQCLIRPCLSVNLRDVINWFCILVEKLSSEEMFLASADKYIKENGPEALERLIANKENCKEHILADGNAVEVEKKVESPENITAEEQLVVFPILQRAHSCLNTQANCKEHILADANVLEVEKKVESPENITAEEQLVEVPKADLVQSEKKETAAAEAQQGTLLAESEERSSLEIHALKKVQKEWTCAMCQVTTTSEAVLNSHLRGKKHRSKCEKLNTCTQTAKNMQSPAVKQKSKPEELKTSTQSEKRSNSLAAKTNGSNQANGNLQNSPPGGGSRQNTTKNPHGSNQANGSLQNSPPGGGAGQNTTKKPQSNHINVASSQQMQVKAMKNNVAVVNQQSKFWCTICNIQCNSETDLAAHLKGRKHILEIQSKPMNNNAEVVNQQDKFWCSMCNIRCTSEVDMAAHLTGRKHVLEMQSQLWCNICNVRCTSEMDMAAHLRGRKHVVEIQSKISSGGGAWA